MLFDEYIGFFIKEEVGIPIFEVSHLFIHINYIMLDIFFYDHDLFRKYFENLLEISFLLIGQR
jgi:hypothetical protein